MARRSKARQVVLQMLFQCDLNADVGPHTVRAMINEQIEDRALRNFSWGLYSGVMENRNAIDARIQRVAQNWSLDRMAPTDRNVLRMCVFEMLYSDTPPPVAVDEAIDLARTFGTNQSAPFVNGLLDQLMPGARPPAAVRQDAAAESAAGEATPPGQEASGNLATDESAGGRRDPRRRMAGHNAQLTPSVPGMKAYIQPPAVPLSMTPQTPPAEAAPETEAPSAADADANADNPVADSPIADSPAEVPVPEVEVIASTAATPAGDQAEDQPQEPAPSAAESVSAGSLPRESGSLPAETHAEQSVEDCAAGEEPAAGGSPQADLSQDTSPDTAPPQVAPREAGTPEAVTPEAVTPEDVTPEDVTPEDVTPETVAAEEIEPAQVESSEDDSPQDGPAQYESPRQDAPQDDSRQNA